MIGARGLTTPVARKPRPLLLTQREKNHEHAQSLDTFSPGDDAGRCRVDYRPRQHPSDEARSEAPADVVGAGGGAEDQARAEAGRSGSTQGREGRCHCGRFAGGRGARDRPVDRGAGARLLRWRPELGVQPANNAQVLGHPAGPEGSDCHAGQGDVSGLRLLRDRADRIHVELPHRSRANTNQAARIQANEHYRPGETALRADADVRLCRNRPCRRRAIWDP